MLKKNNKHYDHFTFEIIKKNKKQIFGHDFEDVRICGYFSFSENSYIKLRIVCSKLNRFQSVQMVLCVLRGYCGVIVLESITR